MNWTPPAAVEEHEGMSDDIRARNRKILGEQLEALWQDYEAAIKQTTAMLGAPDRNRVERQAEEIYRQIETLDSKLKSLELARADDSVAISEPDAARIQEKLRSKLHAIDFKELEKTIKIILRDHRQGGCAALLLFQESDKRGGDWCAARIRELLQRETNEGGFREITVGFKAFDQANGMELLRRIGQYLGIEAKSHDSTNSFSQDVVQTLCGSLQNGSVVMIKCQRCDDIFDEIDEFRRVLEDFWRNMVSGLEMVSKQCCEVKVITLLFTDKPLLDDCLVDYCCTIDQFQKDRLLKLSQEEWTQEDIRVWIARYSGLSLTRIEINRMAKNIYESAGGLPIVVEHRLLEECCPMTAG